METKAIFANRFTNKVITNIKISGNETATKKDGDDDKNIDLVTDKANSFLGIEEIGDNVSFTNKVFEGLMKKAGWYEGLQWCAFFVKMVFTNTLPSYKPCFDKVFDGSSQKTFKNAKAQLCPYLKAFSSGPIKKGDVLIFQNLKNKSFGHVGIVSKLITPSPDKNGRQSFISIEGNARYDPKESTNALESKTKEELVDYVPHTIKIGEISSYYTEKRLIGVVRFSTTKWKYP